MENLTNEQLLAAREIHSRQLLKKQKNETLELAVELKSALHKIIEKYFQAEPVDGEWISERGLAQVAYQAVKSLSDYRHRYAHSVTAFKYVSIITFWIVKLKPINGLGLKKDDHWLDCPDINERVALRWLEFSVWQLVTDNKVPEFLPASNAVNDDLRKIFQFYFYDNLYAHNSDEKDSHGGYKNNKSYETAHYMRYKKLTAINIYESIIHLLLPVKVRVATL